MHGPQASRYDERERVDDSQGHGSAYGLLIATRPGRNGIQQQLGQPDLEYRQQRQNC